jgi:hypothetical protein
MGGGGSSVPSDTSSTTRQELPGYAQPYAVNLLERGYNMSNTPYQAYGGQRTADLTPEQQAGLSMTRDRALTGAADVNAARQQGMATTQGAYFGASPSAGMLQSTIAGDYLKPESNPYLSATVGKAMDDVSGKLNAQFNSAGGYGGSAHQETAARELGTIANQMYGQNYLAERGNQMQAANLASGEFAQERGNQMRAMGMAPQLGQTDYADASALLGVGDVYGQRQQQMLNQQYEDWNQAINYPYQQLDILSNALAGSTGGRSTTIQSGAPTQYNPTASAIGGGLLGYGVGSMAANQFGSYSPYIGAGLGALAGYGM